MSAPTPRRALPLIVGLTLLLAGCDGGEGKPGVPSGLGDTNPGVGEAPRRESPCFGTVERCTAEQIADTEPCGEDSGSACAPDNGAVIPWVGPGTEAPTITWTFPCTPDGFEVHLDVWVKTAHLGQGWSMSPIQVAEEDLEDPVCSWLPEIDSLEPGHNYRYTVQAVLVNGSPLHGQLGQGNFWVGPMCEGQENVDDHAPRLVYPSEDSTFAPPEQFMQDWPDNLTWAFDRADSDDCLIEFEAEASTDPTFAADVMPIVTSGPMSKIGMISGTVEWCHTYYWHVRAKSADYAGPWSKTWSLKMAPPEGWDACFKGAGAVEAVAIQDSTCRVGPSTVYPIAGYAGAGDRLLIVGRNAAGTWFQTAEGCYISRNLLIVEIVQGTPFPGGADVGSLMGIIPEVPDPPLPTATVEEECSSGMSAHKCAAMGGAYNYDLEKCVCP